jgi:hypothetical protein
MPLPISAALLALMRCIATTAVLLMQRRVHLPTGHRGMRLHFADGSSARVYRETVMDSPAPADPCVLVVAFRLRGIRGWGHAWFRRGSLLNTPLFVGFPGFVSKLWLAHDAHGVYRGLYEWNGPGRAEAYARALWPVLALVSDSQSIRYQVLSGLRRDVEMTCSPIRGFRRQRRPGTRAGGEWSESVNPSIAPVGPWGLGEGADDMRAGRKSSLRGSSGARGDDEGL